MFLNPLPSSSSTTSSSNFNITVSDPRKEESSSSNSFITYLITTRNSLAAPASTVRRRFRDIITLSDSLAESHRGLFIPQRPEKNLLESQVMHKHEFIEQRRAALEKYLQRLAAHPVIGQSEQLKVFLYSGVVVVPARGGRDVVRMFKELRQLWMNDLVGGKTFVVEEDRVFLERKGRMQDLEVQIKASSDKTEALVKAQQDIAETMGDLGLSFVKLVKLENNEVIYMSERSLAVDAKVVATAAVKASRLYRELNAQTIRHLETLREYTGLMQSIWNAFSERSNALLTMQTLLSDLASWNARAENLEAASARSFGGNDSRILRLEEIRRTIRITEDAKSCATRDYEKIKENNKYELERFDKDREDDFLNMLRGLATNQVGYFQKIADVWERVASETSHHAKT